VYVGGGPVEGSRRRGEGDTVTLTQYNFIMQQLIAHDHDDASFPFFLP